MSRRRIALLCQKSANPSGDQMVVGSNLSCRGLAHAFVDLGHDAYVFGERDLAALEQFHPDVVVVEGWSPAIPRVESYDFCRKVFWLLSFLAGNGSVERTLGWLEESGFDAIAHNAVSLPPLAKPSAYIPLAFPPQALTAEPDASYQCDFLYVGLYPHKSDAQYDLLLGPAESRDLALYGKGWGRHARYLHKWRGVLPIADTYRAIRSARATLALVEENQRRQGMLNLRYFEAPACRSLVVSEAIQVVDPEMQAFVCFVSSSEEAAEWYRRVERADAEVKRRVDAGFAWAKRTNQGYDDRARRFLRLLESL